MLVLSSIGAFMNRNEKKEGCARPGCGNGDQRRYDGRNKTRNLNVIGAEMKNHFSNMFLKWTVFILREINDFF